MQRACVQEAVPSHESVNKKDEVQQILLGRTTYQEGQLYQNCAINTLTIQKLLADSNSPVKYAIYTVSQKKRH